MLYSVFIGRRATRALRVVLLLVMLPALAASPLVAAKAPVNKTYFTVILGLDSSFGWQADCLRFTKTELCTIGETCGTWELSEAAGAETAFTFEISFEESGVEVAIEGQGRIDDRGKSSSVAAVARAQIGGRASNFGLTGRATSAKKCLRLRRAWDLQNPPAQPVQSAQCLAHASFGSPGQSPYQLPFATGRSYRVGQTYCVAGDTHENQLAYDFMLPPGAPVVAARAGTVREIRSDVADEVSDEDAGIHNHVYVEHDDGTVGFYAHLQQDGVLVAVGESVEAGEQIGVSGSSGSDVPLLHFGVYSAYPPSEGDDRAVNFHNAEGPLDSLGGLIQDVFYTAVAD